MASTRMEARWTLALAAILLGGCVGAPTEDVEAAAADPPPAPAPGPPAARPVEPISREGSLGVGVVACPAGACITQTILPSERIFETTSTGRVDVALAMTWDAVTPNHEELLLGAFTCDPDACASDADLTWIEWATGPSPLTYERTDVAIPEGQALHVFMNTGAASPSAYLFVRLATPQPFAIEGTLAPRG